MGCAVGRPLNRVPPVKVNIVSFRYIHLGFILASGAQIPRKICKFSLRKVLVARKLSVRQSDLAHTQRWTEMAKKPEAKPKEAAPKPTGKGAGEKAAKKGGKK